MRKSFGRKDNWQLTTTIENYRLQISLIVISRCLLDSYYGRWQICCKDTKKSYTVCSAKCRKRIRICSVTLTKLLTNLNYRNNSKAILPAAFTICGHFAMTSGLPTKTFYAFLFSPLSIHVILSREGHKYPLHCGISPPYRHQGQHLLTGRLVP